jgi:hypothetical protein
VALAGKGVLAIWNGIAAEAEADFVAWHIREHIPERVGVEGFLRGRRYVAERGQPKYFNFYETQTPDTLVSPAYVARLNAPSDWTKSVVRHFRDTSRTICAVAASRGLGDGAFIATLRLGTRFARADFLGKMTGLLDALSRAPSIVAVHLLEGQGGGGNGQTAEKELRGQADETVDWILLVEAVEMAPLDAALREHLFDLPLGEIATGFEPERDYGIYRFQFGLAREQLA